MMQKEFEKLVGHPVDNECYKRIEAVYMFPLFDDMFPSKEAVADYYKKHDMQGFENLYKVALKARALETKAQNLEKELTAQESDFKEKYQQLERAYEKETAANKRLSWTIENLKEIIHKAVDMM